MGFLVGSVYPSVKPYEFAAHFSFGRLFGFLLRPGGPRKRSASSRAFPITASAVRNPLNICSRRRGGIPAGDCAKNHQVHSSAGSLPISAQSWQDSFPLRTHQLRLWVGRFMPGPTLETRRQIPHLSREEILQAFSPGSGLFAADHSHHRRSRTAYEHLR